MELQFAKHACGPSGRLNSAAGRRNQDNWPLVPLVIEHKGGAHILDLGHFGIDANLPVKIIRLWKRGCEASVDHDKKDQRDAVAVEEECHRAERPADKDAQDK